MKKTTDKIRESIFICNWWDEKLFGIFGAYSNCFGRWQGKPHSERNSVLGTEQGQRGSWNVFQRPSGPERHLRNTCLTKIPRCIVYVSNHSVECLRGKCVNIPLFVLSLSPSLILSRSFAGLSGAVGWINVCGFSNKKRKC